MEKKIAYCSVCSGTKCHIFVLHLNNRPEVVVKSGVKKTQVPETRYG